MKFFVSEVRNRRTVFFSEADSYTVYTQRIPEWEVLRNLKLASLLYDHVILAGAYFWQSPIVFSCISRLETLVGSGDILLTVREPSITRDFSDYWGRRLKETAGLADSIVSRIPALASEIARPDQRGVVVELDALGTILYRDTLSVEQTFRAAWLHDTLDESSPNSLYNLTFMSTRPGRRRGLLEELRRIAGSEYFSRGTIARHVMEQPVPGPAKALVIQRGSDLYLLSNAIACESDLLSTHRTLAYPAYYMGSIGPLASGNVELFMSVLDLCGLPTGTVDSLTGEELLVLKASKEFLSFRDAYQRLVRSVKAEEEDFVREVLQEFSYMQREETLKKRLLSILKYIERISAAICLASLSALFKEYTPEMMIVLTGSSVEATVSHFLRQGERLASTPVLDFVGFLARRGYRTRVLPLFAG